jgi:hypothetical protein
MIEVLNKLGKNKEVMGILRASGWSGSYARFAMQKTRGKLTSDVALILWDYCEKNGIKVKPEDFKGE